MGKFIDLSGQKFNHILVIERVPRERGSTGATKWKCVCDCGKNLVITGYELKIGHTKSCGCMKVERIRLLNKKNYEEGFQKTSEYQSWKAMIHRCNNPNYRYYHEYGGRGISVCDRWRDFGLFLEDMGSKPSPKHSIDRIDVNGNYEPGNCRWATSEEQTRNSRVRKDGSSGVRGVYLDKTTGKWIANISVGGKKRKFGKYENKEDAIKARRELEIKYWGKSS
jgi:hypothetical protein